MEGYIIYKGEIKTIENDEQTVRNTTNELNRKQAKMQNSNGKGEMEIDIKENIQQFVTKVEHVNERVEIMEIKTKVQGKQW